MLITKCLTCGCLCLLDGLMPGIAHFRWTRLATSRRWTRSPREQVTAVCALDLNINYLALRRGRARPDRVRRQPPSVLLAAKGDRRSLESLQNGADARRAELKAHPAARCTDSLDL